MRLRPFFETNSYGPRKNRKDCVNPFCISGHALFFDTKTYDVRKRQILRLLTVYWAFLANYSAKSNIIGLIEATGLTAFFIIG